MDRLDEWIGEIHLFSPTSTFWPEQGAGSNTDLGAGPKVSSNSQAVPIIIKGTSQEMKEQLVGTNLEL